MFCEYCGIETKGEKICNECFEINEAYIKRRRLKYKNYRKENALCLSCGKPLDGEGVNCSKCKVKLNEYSKAYYKANSEKAKESNKRWRIKNKTKLAKKQKEYYEANKEKIRKRNLEYYHKKRVGIND